MILGDTCTRGCRFCAVKCNKLPAPVDENEPERLSLAIAEMGIRHAVITSVTRDDLPDGGAGHYAKTVRTLRKNSPETTIELLIPDFGGSEEALRSVVDEGPDILAHNVDTVVRLHRKIKPRANHDRSLTLLRRVKEMAPKMVTKSGIMLGLGETAEDVAEELKTLRDTGCNMVTLGQYLAPSSQTYSGRSFSLNRKNLFFGGHSQENSVLRAWLPGLWCEVHITLRFFSGNFREAMEATYWRGVRHHEHGD